MLRDDRNDEGRRRVVGRNVLGEPIEICSITPMTGFFGTAAATLADRTSVATRYAP